MIATDLEFIDPTGPIVRTDLAALEALMLWPDDAAARDRWRRAARLETLAPLLDEMSLEQARVFARDALSVPRLPELQTDARSRREYGIVAGAVVGEAIFSELAGTRYGVDEIRRRIKANAPMQIELQTMKNNDGPVQRYRPVVHFWAAYLFNSLQRGDATFPCRREGLLEFLALAEFIRFVGEKTKPFRSTTTILRPGDAMDLPPLLLLALPELSVDLRRVANQ